MSKVVKIATIILAACLVAAIVLNALLNAFLVGD